MLGCIAKSLPFSLQAAPAVTGLASRERTLLIPEDKYRIRHFRHVFFVNLVLSGNSGFRAAW